MKRRILLFSRAYRAMTNEVDWSDMEETGGILLGYKMKNKIIVIEAVDGGPKRVASKTSFHLDYDYVQYVASRISHLYKPPLVLVGVWHKHNSFHENPFSEDDENIHKEICSLSNGNVVSILFQLKNDRKFIMNTYWVDAECKTEKVDFVICKRMNDFP